MSQVLLFVLLGQRLQQFFHALVQDGMSRIGRDLSEGQQDEAALVHAWVRHEEPLGGENAIAVENEVQVEGARAICDAVAAVAAEETFDLKQAIEQRLGCEGGFKRDGGIQKGGLIGVADGLSGVEARACGDVAELTQLLNGGLEGGLRSAGDAGQIRAKRDICRLHGGNHRVGAKPAGWGAERMCSGCIVPCLELVFIAGKEIFRCGEAEASLRSPYHSVGASFA